MQGSGKFMQRNRIVCFFLPFFK
ncbi:uncharacterized protein METZ01_LOCUS100568, partial [marine metagenome]